MTVGPSSRVLPPKSYAPIATVAIADSVVIAIAMRWNASALLLYRFSRYGELFVEIRQLDLVVTFKVIQGHCRWCHSTGHP